MRQFTAREMCYRCKVKPRTKTGPPAYCKDCGNEVSREWRKNNPDKYRNGILKRRYGITVEDYDEILEEQDNGCAICGGQQVGNKPFLAVDHDHEFGYRRGLLCDPCNQALGQFKDSKELLLRALEYLEKWEV